MAGWLQTYQRDGKGGQPIILLALKGLDDGCQRSISLKNWSLPTAGVKLLNLGSHSTLVGDKPRPLTPTHIHTMVFETHGLIECVALTKPITQEICLLLL